MSELLPKAVFAEPSFWKKRAVRSLRNAFGGKAVILCAVALAFTAYAYSVDWKEVSASWASGGLAYPVDGALLTEAKKLNLSYETVSMNPSVYTDKPVLWCLVKVMNPSVIVLNGNLSWVVNISGGDFKPAATARMATCKPTLAVVEKSTLPGVHLRFAGHP